MLIIGGSGSGKTTALLNLINNNPDIDKIYLYAKDPYKAKCQLLINKAFEKKQKQLKIKKETSLSFSGFKVRWR